MTKFTKSKLKSGIVHSECMIVEPQHTVPEVSSWPGFADMPPVFATVMLIGFIEQTCIQSLRPFFTSKQITVGTSVDIDHTSPTPVGGQITAQVELVIIDKSKLIFEVTASDDMGVIGKGSHIRAIVERERIEVLMASKYQLISGNTPA